MSSQKKGNGVTFVHGRRKFESMTSHTFLGFSSQKRADPLLLLTRCNLALIPHFNSAASEAALFKLLIRLKERIVLASLHLRPECGRTGSDPFLQSHKSGFSQCQVKLDLHCLPEITTEISESDQSSKDYARTHTHTQTEG